MRRIEYDRYGDGSRLRLAAFDPPEPGDDEVLVKVVAAAANPMDWKIRQGAFRPVSGWRFPRGVGHDFAGVVEQAGKGASRFRPGDEVFGSVGMSSGAFADRVVASAKFIARKPAGLSFSEAAALPITGVTALQALERAGIVAGGQVFVNGVLGGVGRATAQLARVRGASVAGSCRDVSDGVARALGVDPVVGFDFDAAPLTGRFDLVFDTPGTLRKEKAYTLLKHGGRVIDITPTPTKIVRSMLTRKFDVLIARMEPADLDSLGRSAAEGELTVAIARTTPLADAIESLIELEDNRLPQAGKLIIVP